MKIHIITVGKPKLVYAKLGWEEYLKRLQRFHTVNTTHLADRHAYDASKILAAALGTTIVVLEITGSQFTSLELAQFLELRTLESREVSFIIGGPEGLPAEVIQKATHSWSLGSLTLPHDLAMVVTLEALYRASTISAKLPYHKY